MPHSSPSPDFPSPDFNARSWLFAPGDSARKMAKACDSAADIVLLDLEDSVAPGNKGEARKLVKEAIAARENRHRIWVRINPLDTDHALVDLAAVMPERPGGILLPKANGRADVERLNHYLSALEAAHCIARGTTKVAALVTETAAAMFTTGDYTGSPRLVAMSWGAEDLSDALGASESTLADGEYAHTYELARSLCLVGAVAARVLPIETIQADFRDLDGLKARAQTMWRAGYRGMLAIHPAQVDVINAAFSPSEAEIADAKEIVALFADNPGVGTIGFKGRMLDRPHLARAQNLLTMAERS